jgi:3-methyladenine DNA glycosylase Tag
MAAAWFINMDRILIPRLSQFCRVEIVTANRTRHWSVVFGKRDAFREAFHNFNIAKVAAMTGHDVDRLLRNPSVIRNRAMIKAIIGNARAMMSASPGLSALAKS